jgi:peptidoglycan/LPS O-acetylase OafA/YrhL
MYLSIYSSPIGSLAALSYSDVRRQYENKAILIRSAASLIVFIASLALIIFVSEAEVSPLLKNQGWILIVLVAPLITAIATNNILGKNMKRNRGRNT